MGICRDCPSELPQEGPDVHPAFRRVLCDGCRRRVKREAKRRAKGPPKPGPARRERRPASERLEGTRLSRLYQRIRDYVGSLKAGRPCLDCGLSFPPVCMDFDHRPTETKVREISKCRTVTQVDTEVAKCDLICSNCHRLRTEARRLALLSARG